MSMVLEEYYEKSRRGISIATKLSATGALVIKRFRAISRRMAPGGNAHTATRRTPAFPLMTLWEESWKALNSCIQKPPTNCRLTQENTWGKPTHPAK